MSLLQAVHPFRLKMFLSRHNCVPRITILPHLLISRLGSWFSLAEMERVALIKLVKGCLPLCLFYSILKSVNLKALDTDLNDWRANPKPHSKFWSSLKCRKDMPSWFKSILFTSGCVLPLCCTNSFLIDSTMSKVCERINYITFHFARAGKGTKHF